MTGNLLKYFRWVPNFITSLNILSGCMAVFFGADGQLGWAAIFIFAAAVFDFFDGFSARLLHAYSPIGKDLDSLADVISFGLAPATIVFSMLELSLFGKNQPIFEIEATLTQWVLLFSAMLIPVAGAFRLAKFNNDTRQSESFIGLPIPGNAFFFASLALLIEVGTQAQITQLILKPYLLLTAIITSSYLMVSEIPMFSMKVKNLKWANNQVRYLFVAGILLLAIFLKFYALPLIIIWYVLLSVISRAVKIRQ